MIDISEVAENLRKVKSDIAAAAKVAERSVDSVSLVAVSKTKPVELIHQALATGHRLFGENRVQEIESKWPGLKEAYPDARLHVIGPLQRNKIRKVLALVDVIETIDTPKLAEAVARIMDETGCRADCYIQVNTGEEPQKAGVLPQDLDAFVAQCRETYQLPVKGLMCIPPFDEEPSLHFALLRDMAARNGLDLLSMGMSDDFDTAIRFGATHVRIGTAIFGARAPFNPG